MRVSASAGALNARAKNARKKPNNSVTLACWACSAMAVAPPEAMNCWSEDTIERSVKSPATTHAIVGTRVLLGEDYP